MPRYECLTRITASGPGGQVNGAPGDIVDLHQDDVTSLLAAKAIKVAVEAKLEPEPEPEHHLKQAKK